MLRNVTVHASRDYKDLIWSCQYLRRIGIPKEIANMVLTFL